MLYDPDDLAILKGVLGLATAFRRQVIAEGVETVEHGVLLLQLGCELAQGYGIARPMPARDFPSWAAAWQPDPVWRERPSVSMGDLPLFVASVELRAWIVAFESFLSGGRKTPPQMDIHKCCFGTWLDSDGLARHGAHHAFHTTKEGHSQIHLLATAIFELHSSARIPEALAKLGELHDLRDDLLEQVKSLVQKN